VVAQAGPFLTQQTVPCSTCSGEGQIWREKDKCRKCKGKRTTKERKAFEVYIPRGSRNGERVVLAGEADQSPGQEPGDLVFQLSEKEHEVFARKGADLKTWINITLAEALCGFSRVVLTHLDGRGIQLSHQEGQILEPGQVLKVVGEGMPQKKTDTKGDLYLIINVKFPDEAAIQNPVLRRKLKELLPEELPAIKADEVDEVSINREASLDGFGKSFNTGEAEDGWEDEDEQGDAQDPRCAQQ